MDGYLGLTSVQLPSLLLPFLDRVETRPRLPPLSQSEGVEEQFSARELSSPRFAVNGRFPDGVRG